MNNIRNALRYIYIGRIYRLNHAEAGWAYDRQSRKIWRRKAKASGSDVHYKINRHKRVLGRCIKRVARNDWERGYDLPNRGVHIRYHFAGYENNHKRELANLRVFDIHLPCRALTSKEAA